MFLTNLDPVTGQAAIEKRDVMLAERAFSDSQEKIAVVTSLVMNRCEMSPDEAAKLRRESLAILDSLRLLGTAAIDVLSPTVADLDAIFQDPSITDLCVIGEGAIGNLFVREGPIDPTCGTDYDWIAVSKAADHLKTGSMFQRMCSVVSFSPVIWSTFATADLRKIWISEVPSFDPVDLHTMPNQGLYTAYQENNVSYASLWDLANTLSNRGNSQRAVDVQ